MEYSTAFLFMTGRTPGRPRMTGSTWELGSPPKPLAAPVNILLLVASWTWISIPTRTLWDWTIRCWGTGYLFLGFQGQYRGRECSDEAGVIAVGFASASGR